MIRKTKAIAAISAVIAVVASLAVFAPMGIALASHNAEPTMWVNGINAHQSHSYIYMVPGPTHNMDMAVALMIKDMEEKHHVKLSVTDQTGAVTGCPMSTVTTTGAQTLLLVSECFFSPPTPGLYTITITAGAIGNNPVGYAIAADTVTGPYPVITDSQTP